MLLNAIREAATRSFIKVQFPDSIKQYIVNEQFLYQFTPHLQIQLVRQCLISSTTHSLVA